MTAAGGSHATGCAIAAPAALARRLLGLGALIAAALAGRDAPGQVREGFESAKPSWRLAEADCNPRLLYHQRLFQNAHSGQGCEYVKLAAGSGTKALLVHPIPPARVIDELTASLWVKADRAGLQLMVRVVLPRAPATEAGGPLTTLIRGDSYEQIGGWQQLIVSDVRRRLQRQLPILRSQFGSAVDVREAYIDLIVLNAYAGPGALNLWMDDLEVSGHVAASPKAAEAPANMAEEGWRAESAAPVEGPTWAPAPVAEDPVKLEDTVLLARGKPLLVRMIEHNGESFEYLASLGFNAIKLSVSPTPAQLEEAARRGLWLVAPPPHAAGRRITAVYDSVLAWSLGSRLREEDLPATRRLAEEVHSADDRRGRPLVCSPDSGLWSYSQVADILMLDASPLGGSLELTDCAARFRERSRLARFGAPFWATVQTQPALQLEEQWAALGASGPPPLGVEPVQIRLLTYAAIAAGARGICFQSRSPLDAADPATQLRARVLKLLNLELSLLAPWAAGGEYVEDLSTSDPQIRASVLRTERSELLLLMHHAAGQQYAAAPASQRPVSLTAPSVSASPNVFHLTPAELQPLSHHRGAGGLQLALEETEPTSLLVITLDPLVVNYLARRLGAIRATAAQLRYEVVERELAAAERVLEQLARYGRALPSARGRLEQARENLQQSGRLLRTGDDQGSIVFAGRAERSLALVRRAHWEAAAAAFSSPVASPYCVSFASLPLHWELARRLRNGRWGSNVLAAGDFEDLDRMIASGWTQHRSGAPDVEAAVELSPDQPKSGRTALKITASPAPDAAAPAVVERPPVWIASAPLPVRRGQLVRIHGWARLAQPLAGSRDGLMIFDSLGGPSLAQRFRETGPWREFTLYRAAARDADLLVTFALTGLGQASLDEVTVELLDFSSLALGRNENSNR